MKERQLRDEPSPSTVRWYERRLDAAEQETERLRSRLRAIAFNLEQCACSGDEPPCPHSLDILTIARAEVERLRTEHTYAVADVKQLEAEVERLTLDNRQLQGNVNDSDHNELVELRAENERLRATLQEIADRASDIARWTLRDA